MLDSLPDLQPRASGLQRRKGMEPLDSRRTLPKGTVLVESFRIIRVIGSGGFGITYEAEDTNLGTLVAVKEYFPEEFGDRDAHMSVRPRSERHRQTFQWGRSSFLQEARTLARFDHPSIVRVSRVFEANSTAYMVMRLERGQSFESWLKALGRLPTQDELDRIAAPLLDALEIMHADQFLHRDIAPDNIIVRPNGTPVLLDFGAARSAVAQRSRALTGIVKAGYSPHEQYSTDGRLQGPWSDLYALGGTFYRAVTGRAPDEATLRVSDDRMPTASRNIKKGKYRPSFLAAIDACLASRPADRPQSVAALRPLLLGQEAAPISRISSRKVISAPVPRASSPVRWQWAAVAGLAIIIFGTYGSIEYNRWSVFRKDRDAASTKRVADAVAEKKKAFEEARAEADAKRQADADAFKREQEDAQVRQREAQAAEQARQQSEARERTEAAAAQKASEEAAKARDAQEAADRRAAEERARQDAEARRQAEGAAARKASEEAARARDAQAAADKRAAEERARQQAETRRQADASAARKANEDALARAREAELAAEKRRVEERTRQEADTRRQLAEPFRIRRYWQSHGDCQPRPLVPVSIARAPKYGKIEFRAETGVAEKSSTGKCVGTLQNYQSLYYHPSSPTVTEDRVSLVVQFHAGTRRYDCLINVKDRKVECEME
jgi:serine/threonine protein kinase